MAYTSPSKEELLGERRARDYYKTWVSKYEAERDAEMKNVAVWYAQECKKQWEKRQKEGEGKRLEEMSNRELLTLLRNLNAGEYR